MTQHPEPTETPDDPRNDPEATIDALETKVLGHPTEPTPEPDADLPTDQPDNDAPV